MKIIKLLLLCCFLTNCNSNWEDTVKKEVAEMEEFMIETEREGNHSKQQTVYSDDYGYIDISGNKVDTEKLKERRDEDHKRSISLDATDLEIIPLSPTLAISKGRWDGVSIYYGGIPRKNASRYMAIWRKENGLWKLLADQVTDIVSRKINRPTISVGIEELKGFEGSFELQLKPRIVINTKIKSDTLNLFISGQIDNGMPLLPSYEDVFFSNDRPWEIYFKSNDSIIFTSWGQQTIGIKK